MELISLTGALIVAAFIGFNILYLVIGRFDRLYLSETVFISYGLGIGTISLEMLIFYLLGLKFSIYGISAPWILLIAVNAYRRMRSGKRLVFASRPPADREKHQFLNTFLASGITLEVIYAFFRALIKPIEAYDAIAIYAIKSKIFFMAKAIPETYFPSLIHGFPHPDYPLNIPLIETFMYMAMGSLNDQLVKMIFPLFFLGILCVLYFAVRRFASRTYALLFTFLLATIPMFNSYAANAYQELPLAFYCFASVVFLLAWIEDRSDLRSLTVSAIMVALAGWTKNEGMLYCAINASLVLFLSVVTRKGASAKAAYGPILYLTVIGIILAPWIWIKAKFGIVNDEIDILNLNPVYLFKQLHKLGPVFYELQKQLFGPKKWLLLWPIAIFAAMFNYRKIFSGIQKYISISLILAFCGYLVFYMISYVDVVFFASKTWGRFLLHFLPLLVLWLAYMLKEDIKV